MFFVTFQNATTVIIEYCEIICNYSGELENRTVFRVLRRYSNKTIRKCLEGYFRLNKVQTFP